MTFQKIPACCIALQNLQQRFICSHIIPCVRVKEWQVVFLYFIFSILTKCRHSLIGPWYNTHVLIFLLPLSGQKTSTSAFVRAKRRCCHITVGVDHLVFFLYFFFLLCPTKFNVYSTKHFCSISLALALAAWSPHDDRNLVCFVYRRRCTQQFPPLAAHDRTSLPQIHKCDRHMQQAISIYHPFVYILVCYYYFQVFFF